MTLAFLVATLAALAAGPVLYALAQRHPRALAFLDGFVLISIAGLVLLEVLPGAFLEGGGWSLLFLAAGLFGPTLLERAFRHAEREAHILTLALAIAGLVLHALADGVVLAPAGGDWALPLAVVLHSLPVGMAVWWLLAPHFGALPPALVLAAMGAGTVAGYRYGVSLNALLSDQAWSWFQSVVAGSILHVIFGRPHLHGDEDPHHAHVEHVPSPDARYEGAGNLVALAGLALVSVMHGGELPPVWARVLALSFVCAPVLLLAYVAFGFALAPAGRRWQHALHLGFVELVDRTAARVLIALLLAALLQPQLARWAGLPLDPPGGVPGWAEKLTLTALILLYLASLARRGARRFVADLGPARGTNAA